VASANQQGRHLVVFAAEGVPADFVERVTRLGGSIEASLENIGVAAVTGLTDATAAELAATGDIRAIEPDPITKLPDMDLEPADDPAEQVATASLAAADATASPITAPFYSRQWNLRAVFAPQAWAAGHLGSRDVVVAILDTGIDYLHPDLAGLVDLERSVSFAGPEEDAAVKALYPDRLPFSDLFWHGTAAASIVASNAKGLAGVNRYVTLLAVKIADRANQSSAGRMLSGIMHAADRGADVISVSSGWQFNKSDNPKSTVPGMVAAFERAASYAFRKGSLIVSLPFNDGADLDHNGDLVRFPCQAAHVICVSATAPTGAAGVNGPWENVDARAQNVGVPPYSGFGRSAVDVAAPGGGGGGNPNLHVKVWLPCTTTPSATTARPGCRNPNLSLPPERRIEIGVGTSWATPHVAGLAALLVVEFGHGNPALIRARILQSADDCGAPGHDPFYGQGRINIARALGLTEVGEGCDESS
jgi:subtilisin family serine protease